MAGARWTNEFGEKSGVARPAVIRVFDGDATVAFTDAVKVAVALGFRLRFTPAIDTPEDAPPA